MLIFVEIVVVDEPYLLRLSYNVNHYTLSTLQTYPTTIIITHHKPTHQHTLIRHPVVYSHPHSLTHLPPPSLTHLSTPTFTHSPIYRFLLQEPTWKPLQPHLPQSKRPKHPPHHLSLVSVGPLSKRVCANRNKCQHEKLIWMLKGSG